MAMPKGYKHTEEAKTKMRRPHKRLSGDECLKRAERQRRYWAERKAMKSDNQTFTINNAVMNGSTSW